MNKPTDYPIHTEQSDENGGSAPADITYAALKDRVDAKQPITDEMIRTARAKLETAHINSATSESTQIKSKLNSIKDRFRPA